MLKVFFMYNRKIHLLHKTLREDCTAAVRYCRGNASCALYRSGVILQESCLDVVAKVELSKYNSSEAEKNSM